MGRDFIFLLTLQEIMTIRILSDQGRDEEAILLVLTKPHIALTMTRDEAITTVDSAVRVDWQLSPQTGKNQRLAIGDLPDELKKRMGYV